MAKNRNKKIVLGVSASLIVICLLVVAGFLGAFINSKMTAKSNLTDGTVDGNVTISADEADLANVVNKVSPSVVSIVTKQDYSYSYFFQQEAEGAGTGIIISKDGYVLTNKHVIKGVKALKIVTSDGTSYDDVKLVGADPLNDIAFLKINGVKDLPVATFGDSGTVRVGQRVIAIGNSLGQYQNTVTSGIISGLGRPVAATATESGAVESLTDLLQTDAAINPGNSGGPLINMAGQVIGINTAIVSNAQSVSFAIPINATKGMARGILQSGKVEKAYLGVQYVTITPDIRAEHKLDAKQGALVQKSSSGGKAVADGSPADKAGLQAGDIIVKVNDKIVGKNGGLGSLIAEFLPGEEIGLTLVRDGEQQEVKVELDAYQLED